MKRINNSILIIIFLHLIVYFSCVNREAGNVYPGSLILSGDTIQYHPVRISIPDSAILPWFSADPGESFDTCLMLVWNFWNKMEIDSNGLKYYMNHQVWSPDHDMRGIGGDQISMALSSWTLLYAYTGYPEIIDNMRYMADTYLERSLSGSDCKWPFIPYPYNTRVHSGIYDGDMVNGPGITQPDKAGTFGYELINLYKITGDRKYLDAAVRIAETLSEHLIEGDSIRSPLPFRVNACTGEPGFLSDNRRTGRKIGEAVYTSNWTGTMRLYEELIKMGHENSEKFRRSFDILLNWMKKYPLRTNKWGPFFEDVPGWSDTQINAVSFAHFILEHRDLFPEWENDVKGIFDWTYRELGNHEYEKYRVTVMNEQTAYRVPGNSHSSRQASVELMYAALSGDTSYTRNAIRALNWATYTVASDGRNRYIRDDIWLTDGYGDYVRHYIRAMGAMPELAPGSKNKFLKTSSVVTFIKYSPNSISYITFSGAYDILRLRQKPGEIKCDGVLLQEQSNAADNSYSWEKLTQGGILRIRHTGKNVEVIF